MNGLNNTFKIAVANIRHFQYPSFLLAFLFLGGLVFLFGVVELGELAVNTVLGRFVPLLGLLLISPLVIHELNEEISDVVFTKAVAHWQILCIRLAISLIYAAALLLGYAGILIANDSVITAPQLINSFINSLFLGSIGFLSITLFKNITTGYMVAILYYLLNFLISKELGMFYLFDMTISKMPLLLCAIICIGFSMYWSGKQK